MEMTATRRIEPYIHFWNQSEDAGNLVSALESVAIVKLLGRPAGTAVLQMVPSRGKHQTTSRANSGDYWQNLFSPMDMVSIGFNDEPPKFVGFVDSPGFSHMYSSDKPQRNNQISFSDLGKLFTHDNILLLPFFQTWLNGGGPFGDSARIIDEVTGGTHPLLHPIMQRGPLGGISFNFTTVGEAAEFVLENWPSQQVRTRYKSSSIEAINGLFETKISYRGQPGSNDLWVDAVTDASGLNTYTGNFWNLLRTIADSEQFYEVFTDIYDGVPHVVVRPTPFDRDGTEGVPADTLGADAITGGDGDPNLNIKPGDPFAWERLRKVTLGEEDVIKLDIQRTDDDAFSIYSVGNPYDLEANLAFTRADLSFAFVDPFALFRFGARPFIPNSQLLRIAKTQDELARLQNLPESEQQKKRTREEQDVKDFLRTKVGYNQTPNYHSAPSVYQKLIAFRDRAFNWYHYNPIFMRGTITTRMLLGHKEVKIGERLWCPWLEAQDGSTGVEFYVTGVIDHWVFGQSSRPGITTLIVQRGASASMRKVYDRKRNEYLNKMRAGV